MRRKFSLRSVITYALRTYTDSSPAPSWVVEKLQSEEYNADIREFDSMMRSVIDARNAECTSAGKQRIDTELLMSKYTRQRKAMFIYQHTNGPMWRRRKMEWTL